LPRISHLGGQAMFNGMLFQTNPSEIFG
jgi:hypothetical protein